MKLYNGDCEEVIDKLIKDGVKFGAIITSPPYNIGKMHSNKTQHGTYAGNNMKESEYQEWQIRILNKCYLLLEDNGHMFYNHKVRIKNGSMIHPLEWIFKTDFTLKQEITWDMGKSANCDKIRFFPFSERIYWMTKNPKTKLFNKLKLSDVWRLVPTHKRKETKHIAVMPDGVVENILNSIDVKSVFDPFMGRGTTGVVCKRYGVDFTGSELCEDSFNLSIENIKNTLRVANP